MRVTAMTFAPPPTANDIASRNQARLNDLSSAVIEAVEKTKGEVLLGSDAHVADSYFSASCGGATANLTTLWGGSSPPHLRGVRDDYCASEPHAQLDRYHLAISVVESAQQRRPHERR